tara:strand:- start:365 stop:637 length:273 start_codon:yes stop_codon:yes gene_type:complete
VSEKKTYSRNPAVTETDIDDELFLVEPESEEVFYMDTVSAGLWRLLEEPASFQDIISVYSAAFPDSDSKQIENDLRKALDDLLERGLALE